MLIKKYKKVKEKFLNENAINNDIYTGTQLLIKSSLEKRKTIKMNLQTNFKTFLNFQELFIIDNKKSKIII